MSESQELKVGEAFYTGKNVEILKEFGWRKPTTLYNSEGFYVRNTKGEQVLTNNQWKMFLW